MLLKALELGPFLANCYIVGSEKTKEGFILDPVAEAETIMDNVRQLDLTIKLIVATHSHPDQHSCTNQYSYTNQYSCTNKYAYPHPDQYFYTNKYAYPHSDQYSYTNSDKNI